MVSVLLNPKRGDERLDPLSIPFTNEFYLLENLTTRLLYLDENGSYQMELASKITVTGPRELEIDLKRSYFSNGDLITATDVKESIQRVLNKGSSHANLKDIVSDIERSSDLKLKVKLKKDSKSFFYYLSLPDLGVLHKTQYIKTTLLASDFVNATSGPFSYKIDGDSYSLIKNKYYKIHSLSYPDEIKLLNYFKTSPHEMLFENQADLGKVSVKYYLENRDKFVDHPHLRVLGVPSNALTFIYFNKYGKGFKDATHRLWLKDLIYKNFQVGEQYSWIARGTKQYFPPESKAYLEKDELEINQKVLKLEKPKDFPKEIIIHTYTTTFQVTVEPLVRMLQKLPGVKIVIKNDIEPKEYLPRMKEGVFDIFLTVMASDYRTPIEAINFEYFSTDSVLEDKEGYVRKNFEFYEMANSESEEIKYLKNISSFIVKSDQVIPLFHSAVPYVYNIERVDIGELNHSSIFHLWKLKKI